MKRDFVLTVLLAMAQGALAADVVQTAVGSGAPRHGAWVEKAQARTRRQEG